MFCKQCIFWDQAAGSVTAHGRCERFPPPNGSAWAETMADDGCGEFDSEKQRQEREAQRPAYPEWLPWAVAALAFLLAVLLAYNSLT